MQSPYVRGPRKSEPEKRRVLLAEKSRYRAACYFALCGAGLCALAFIFFLGALLYGGPFLVLGLAWRSEIRGRLLKAKGLTRNEVPTRARLFGWMAWYENEPDRTAVEKPIDDAPPAPLS